MRGWAGGEIKRRPGILSDVALSLIVARLGMPTGGEGEDCISQV